MSEFFFWKMYVIFWFTSQASPSMLTRLNSLLPSLRRRLSQRSYVSSHPTETEEQPRFLDYLQVINPHHNVRKIKSFGGRVK